MPADPTPPHGHGPDNPGGYPIRSQFADSQEMAEIIELFVSEMPQRIADLRASWERGELEHVKRAVHQLKGASGGYGFPAIGEAAAKLESDLAAALGSGSGLPIQRLQSHLGDLIRLCSRISI